MANNNETWKTKTAPASTRLNRFDGDAVVLSSCIGLDARFDVGKIAVDLPVVLVASAVPVETDAGA